MGTLGRGGERGIHRIAAVSGPFLQNPVLDDSLSYARMIELETRFLEKEWSGEPGLLGRFGTRRSARRLTMPGPRHWQLVLYNMSDANQQARVRTTFKAWGEALQLSVFCVRATEPEQARLRFEPARLVDKSNRITYVRLCTGGAGRVHGHNEVLHAFDPDDLPVFRRAHGD